MKIIGITQSLAISFLLASLSVTAEDAATPPFAGKTIDFPKAFVYQMEKGEGYETIQKCSICHSFGYILNQGKQNRSFWEHETHKMIEAYKAPISPEEEKVIVNYLAKFYGNDNK